MGSAYYNPVSSNVDFGVHVVRRLWMRRIRTRLLVEAAALAGRLGRRWLSVVRLIRGVRPSRGDEVAIAFYRANGPRRELNVYKLANGVVRGVDSSGWWCAGIGGAESTVTDICGFLTRARLR